ncbi:hypothetical protein CCACVL1_03622 [Corchorus capsularis]|uniref:Uncharacterized protein n=1 Tax=Corchorus capsularis TaxID=210143 RepID=A0A1R3JY84_COCAP|nr:hypothetical protein CCACVL1_03622 [Corchorus capsularis]
MGLDKKLEIESGTKIEEGPAGDCRQPKRRFKVAANRTKKGEAMDTKRRKIETNDKQVLDWPAKDDNESQDSGSHDSSNANEGMGFGQ